MRGEDVLRRLSMHSSKTRTQTQTLPHPQNLVTHANQTLCCTFQDNKITLAVWQQLESSKWPYFHCQRRLDTNTHSHKHTHTITVLYTASLLITAAFNIAGLVCVSLMVRNDRIICFGKNLTLPFVCKRHTIGRVLILFLKTVAFFFIQFFNE